MLTLKECFSNIKVVCDSALMNKAERNAIDESLANIASALQAHETALQAPKKESEKPQLKENSDE